MIGKKSRKQPLTCLVDLDFTEKEVEIEESVTKKINASSNGKENKKKSVAEARSKKLDTSDDSDSDLDDIFQSLKRTGIKTNSRPSSKPNASTPRNSASDVRKELFPLNESPKQVKSLSVSKKRRSVLEDDAVPPIKLVRSQGTPKRSSYSVSPISKNKAKECLATPPPPVKGSSKAIISTPPPKKSCTKCDTPTTPLGMARIALHNAAVQESLPCRESEFQNILNFVENKVSDQVGGCMYISGVPGTGKTATVTLAIRKLQSQSLLGHLPKFLFIEINGMRLTDPRQAYVQIYQQVFNKTDRVSPDIAFKKLDQHFNASNSKKQTVVLLVDELDLMCTRKQEVVYNLLDWPSRPSSKLVVLTIANTMDMPERKLKGRVTSRLGLTRLTFLPYTHKQLEEIVQTRLQGNDIFQLDAVRLATRKVAAVSGDARRALEICRRAAELPTHPNDPVKISHIEQAIKEMTNSNIVKLLRSCSEIEKMFLRAMTDMTTRTGIDEVDLIQVLEHLQSLCAYEGLVQPPVPLLLTACFRLKAFRLIFTNDSRAGLHQRLTINFSQDDLHYALVVNS